MRRPGNIACLICGFLLPGLPGCCGVPGLPSGDGLTVTPPFTVSSNVELMNAAEQLVQAIYPQALLIEAQGSPSAGTADTADDIDTWQLVFTEDPDGPDSGTVLLGYSNNQFDDPVYVGQPWLGTIFERLPRDMTLAQAVQRMRDAGHADSFTSVILRKPLTFPIPEEALYAFSLPGRFVLVGALTGDVSVE